MTIDLLAVHSKLDPLDPSSTALVLLDLQEVCIDQWTVLESREALLGNVSYLLSWCRKAGVHIIHVKVAFRLNYPEISPKNKLFSKLATSGLFPPTGEGCDFHDAVKPSPGEIVVTKYRVGAFTGTELDMILRAQGIETLILAGISTTGAVLSAVRQAFDLDYHLIVPSDCCADPDADLNEIVLRRIIASHATITTVKHLEAANAALVQSANGLGRRTTSEPADLQQSN